MNIKDYNVVYDEDSKVVRQLDKLISSARFKAGRLFDALDEFQKNDTAYATRVAPDEDADEEVFLVPQRYRLRNVPDAAILV